MPPVQQHPSNEAKDEVLNLYRQGRKLTQITQATGIPRSTIYYILNREGIRPNRNSTKTERPEYAFLQDKIEELTRENERLIIRRDRLEVSNQRALGDSEGLQATIRELRAELAKARKRITQLEKSSC